MAPSGPCAGSKRRHRKLGCLISSNLLQATAAPTPVVACAPGGECLRNGGPALPCTVAAEGGAGAKQAGESEHTFPPEALEARGASEGCCRHLTLERASSDGVWLAMRLLMISGFFLVIGTFEPSLVTAFYTSRGNPCRKVSRRVQSNKVRFQTSLA